MKLISQSKIFRRIDERLPTILSWLLRKIYDLRFYLRIPNYLISIYYFRKAEKGSTQRFRFKTLDLLPKISDFASTTGFDRHYIYHPAWAARVLARLKPARHIDISSSLHFCTLVSAFIPIEFFDYRPAHLNLPNLKCGEADLCNLAFESNSIMSLSCMHVVEHIGLGRYGDPLDYDGDLKAISELTRVLAPGGHLLFVVPIGVSRLLFNAHRIYSYDQVVSNFKSLELLEYALIPRPEDGDLIVNPDRELSDSQLYGCGCFLFQKN